MRRLLENEKKKYKQPFKRAHLATWGNDDKGVECKEDKDEEALLYLLAMNDEVSDANLV